MQRAVNEIERLRKQRGRRGPDLSIERMIKNTATEASKAHKRFGELAEVWQRLVPQELAAHTALTSLRAGVLHVTVDSSSAAFELDRLLRSGLADQLRSEFRGSLARVKTRTAPGGREKF